MSNKTVVLFVMSLPMNAHSIHMIRDVAHNDGVTSHLFDNDS